MIYLDPRNDLTFKRVFGEHPNLLLSFLNAMLPLEPGKEIVEIEYLSPEMVPQITRVRNSIVDVRCKEKKGRTFIVEMQMLWTTSFQQRVLFNASKAYVRQLKPGDLYDLLQPVYSLNLLNENYLPESEMYHHYRIAEVEGTGDVIKGLEFVFIELQKFKPQTMNDRKLRRLWLRFLTEVGNKEPSELPAEFKENAEIQEAVELVERSSYSESELDAYDAYWDSISVARTLQADARKLQAETIQKILEKGREEGLEKGEQIGLEKGEQIGLEKGEIIGQIRLMEKLLGKVQTPSKNFEAYAVERLQEMVMNLEAEYKKK